MCFFDDLQADAGSLVHRIYRFLEVDPDFRPDNSRKHNVSGAPKRQSVHRFLSGSSALRRLLRPLGRALLSRGRRRSIQEAIRVKNRKKAVMFVETRDALRVVFREDVLRLQELTNRDLSHWL